MTTIGKPWNATNPDGTCASSAGTLFLERKLLYTSPPAHVFQRLAFEQWVTEQLTEPDGTPPTEAKVRWELAQSVDLVFEPDGWLLIRPELDRMDLALRADQMLQEDLGVERQRIRFCYANDRRVRQALRERGELWRTTTQPDDPRHYADEVRKARVALEEGGIYYINAATGTRYLTCERFSLLASLSDAALARQLDEIARYCTQRNRHGHPEISFYGAEPLRFGGPNFEGRTFAGLPSEQLRAAHAEFVRRFKVAVPAALWRDDFGSKGWLAGMHATLTSQAGDTRAPDSVTGQAMDSRIRWLLGGRFEDRELIYDPVFDTVVCPAHDPELRLLWDSLTRDFIANFIREYGDIEYLNLGRVEPTPESAASERGGRRGVYLAEVKVRGEAQPRLLFLRVQRWGIAERLDEVDDDGKHMDLMSAMLQTEEYVKYTLDRRLACLHLGMRLPPRMTIWRASESYEGLQDRYRGQFFPVVYYERDFLPGIPTNTLPDHKLRDPRYAESLARLLGRAAAPNLIIGRSRDRKKGQPLGAVLFDDGDEIVVESPEGLPTELLLVDHGGAFADWTTPSLLPFANAYAQPVRQRAASVPEPKRFAEEYLNAFEAEFRRIQSDSIRPHRGFDRLFKHLIYHPKGSFRCRWEHVLLRLRNTNVPELVEAIRTHTGVFAPAAVAADSP